MLPSKNLNIYLTKYMVFCMDTRAEKRVEKARKEVKNLQELHDKNNPMNKSKLCGAKTRQGNPCRKPPLNGRTRCRLHGALSPSDKEHYRFTSGKFTKEAILERKKQKLSYIFFKALIDLENEIIRNTPLKS